jgi:hypothetical protein
VIPPREDGVLPEGVHDCTADEVVATFGRFQTSDRRMTLAAKLVAYLQDARRSALVSSVIIDGSFTTAKDEPEDIDLVVALKSDIAWDTFDWDSLRPFEYNAISKWAIKQTFRFDALIYPEGSPQYHEAVEFFMKVNPDKHAAMTSRTRKGVLRVRP